MSIKHCFEQTAKKVTGNENIKCRTAKEALSCIAKKACGDDTKEFKSVCDAMNCINEHFDNLSGGGGSGGDSQPQKIHWWFYYPREKIFTFTDKPKVGDFAYHFVDGTTGDGTSYNLKVEPIEEVGENYISLRGGTFNYQGSYDIQAGYFEENNGFFSDSE